VNKTISSTVLATTLIAIAASAGYWLGNRSQSSAATSAATSAASAQPKERKILYYRNPMGLADTSPVPKKDSMGMDYIAVREGEGEDASDEKASPDAAQQIRISAEKVQQLGVRTELASLRDLGQSVSANARIEADERLSVTVAPKFDGYIERLLVNSTGQTVRKGQALLEAYSADLVSAQREYQLALHGLQTLPPGSDTTSAQMHQLADASLARLRNWDISEEQISTLATAGTAQRTLTLRAPASGIVTEKKAIQGMRFQPGDALYQISDLSSIWVIADIFERDIAAVHNGAKARISVDAYPGKPFTGTLTYIYPTLNEQSRTVPVRIELPNPGSLLKPGMFAQVSLAAGARTKVLSVPNSAVIDSGSHQVVLVQVQEGRFVPREVVLGARSDSYQEILQGLHEGERVVVAANFLIDAESNLKAALSGLTQP
jgi:RND family efflux transporter MFP subunit